MNRRNFLKLIGVAVLAPSALVKTPAKAIIAPTVSVVTNTFASTSLDGLLKEVYLPTMINCVFDNAGYLKLLRKNYEP